MGSKVYFLILQAEFHSDILSVGIYRFTGQIQQLCYLFGGLALLYKIYYLDFCGSKAYIFGR